MSTFADLNDSTKVIDFLDRVNEFLKSLAKMNLSTVTNLEDGYYQIVNGQFQLRQSGTWINVNPKLSNLVDGELVATDSNGNIYSTGKNISHFYDHSSFNSGVLGSSHIPNQADGSFYIVSNVNQAITKGHTTSISVDKKGPFRLPPTGGITNQVLKVGPSGALIWSNDNDTTYGVGDGGLSEKNFTTTLSNKLNGISDNANYYTHPTGDGNSHVPAFASQSKVLGYKGGQVAWVNESEAFGAYASVTWSTPNNAPIQDQVQVVGSIDIERAGKVLTSVTYGTFQLSLASLGFTGSKTANNYIHPNSDGNRHIPVGGTDGQVLKTDGAGNYEWIDQASGVTGSTYVSISAPHTTDFLDSSGELSSRSTTDFAGAIVRTDEYLIISDNNTNDNSNPYNDYLFFKNLETDIWTKITTSCHTPSVLKSTDGRAIVWNNKLIVISNHHYNSQGKLDLIDLDTLAVTNGSSFATHGKKISDGAVLVGDELYFPYVLKVGQTPVKGILCKYNLATFVHSNHDFSSWWNTNVRAGSCYIFSVSKSKKSNHLLLGARHETTPYDQRVIEYDYINESVTDSIDLTTKVSNWGSDPAYMFEHLNYHYVCPSSTVRDSNDLLSYIRIDSSVGVSTATKLQASGLTPFLSNTTASHYPVRASGVRNGFIAFNTPYTYNGDHAVMFLNLTTNQVQAKIDGTSLGQYSQVTSTKTIRILDFAWGEEFEIFALTGLWDLSGGSNNNIHVRFRQKIDIRSIS
ncbi:MAG: hypothetical protein KC646_10285 [Candidatus Cloacimonetes bacterium]|nr:hypothetical protein [Candidatus Cloacimonadota bacterium]